MDSFATPIDELLHTILDVPDRTYWRIDEKQAGSGHPGVCWELEPAGHEALTYKGSSRQPRRAEYLYAKVVLEPNPNNQLARTTYFDIAQRYYFNLRKLSLLYHDRLIGRLSAEDADKFKDAISDLQRGADAVRVH